MTTCGLLRNAFGEHHADPTSPRRGKLRRAFTRLVIVACALGMAGLAGVWYAARGSLPRLQGSAQLAGLQAPVIIERDAHGVPTIMAETLHDAIRAQGYLHGQERFFQMDLTRRSAAGELSALIGTRGLGMDERARVMRSRTRAQQILLTLPEHHRELLQIYAEGVNAGLHDLRSWPLEYWLLRTRPQPWRAEDSMLVNFAFFSMLSVNARYERSAGLIEHTVAPELFAFLTPHTTRWDRPIDFTDADDPSGGYVPLPIPAADVLDLRAVAAGALPQRDVVRNFGDRPIGSNAWLINGVMTVDGRAILASDPHLPLSVPNIWYRVALRWQDSMGARFMSGVSSPGLPGVLIGATDDFAWGLTNTYMDQEDLVIVETDPDDPQRYRTADGWEAFTVHHEAIETTGEPARMVEIRETRWGPVVSETRDGRLLALRSVALDAERVNLNLLDLHTARTLEEALDIAASWWGPAQNVLIADSTGRIGWTVSGWLPARVGFDGKTPRSWADGDVGWRSAIDEAQRPRVIDPASSFIITANGRTVAARAADGAVRFGHAWASSIRSCRIDQLLRSARDSHAKLTEHDMLTMQLDTRSQLHDLARDIVLEVTSPDDADATLAQLHRVVEAWNGCADIDQSAFGFLRELHEALRERIIGSMLMDCVQADRRFVYRWPLVDEPLFRVLEERPVHLVPQPFADWRAYLRDIVVQVAQQRSEHGPRALPADTVWGDENRLAMSHPLLGALPMLGGWANMPDAALPGHATTVRVATPTHGASMRMVVSPGRWEQAIIQMPGGQSGHVLSGHYRDQHAAWLEGAAMPMRDEAVVHTLQLVP